MLLPLMLSPVTMPQTPLPLQLLAALLLLLLLSYCHPAVSTLTKTPTPCKQPQGFQCTQLNEDRDKISGILSAGMLKCEGAL
jgi:hypothetical protein